MLGRSSGKRRVFNKIAIQARADMDAYNEAVGLSRTHSCTVL